ncbi:MAG TPA: glycogen/starch synthase, partial [Cellvibrio sp.]
MKEHELEPAFAERLKTFRAETAPRKKVLFVTPEYTGLIKAGGLGDVSAALPRALSRQHDVRILIPGYRAVLQKNLPMQIVARLEGLAKIPACKIGQLQLGNGPIIYVLICPELYDREGSPYGGPEGNEWDDNHIRFARLGLAAAEFALGKGHIGWRPDLI